MGRQFERLACEELKKYFLKCFDEFKENKNTILQLIHQKTQYVIKLHGNLEDKLSTLSDRGGINQREVFEDELHKVFDERNGLREEMRKKGDEFFPPPVKNAPQYEEFRAEVLEAKLDLIEEELNSRGIIVKMVDDKIIFVDKDKREQK